MPEARRIDELTERIHRMGWVVSWRALDQDHLAEAHRQTEAGGVLQVHGFGETRVEALENLLAAAYPPYDWADLDSGRP